MMNVNMTCRNFLVGMAMGLAVGSGVGMLVSPRTRCRTRSAVGRCLENMGAMIDDVSGIFR